MEDGRAISGSGWEAMLITSAIWAGLRKRDRIIAVLFSGQWKTASPSFLAGLPYINLADDVQFERSYLDLLRNLTGQQDQAPALGASRELARHPNYPLGGPNQSRFTIVSQVAVPRQLPPPPLDFVGRDGEIKKLVNAVRQGATVIGVRGIGGIGKTALALAVADMLAVDF